MTRRGILATSALLLALACSTDDPFEFQPLTLELPGDPGSEEGYAPLDRFAAMDIPADNPVTAAKATLGWQLYHDPRLSGDGSRSCYSCHVCEHGLTDGLPTAIGAYEKPLTRSSPTMWNVGYHWALYWDGRAPTLEKQALAAWKGGNMGASDPEAIVGALNAVEGYRTQFLDVFGEEATVDNVPKALATYMRTIVSGDTAFDRWQAGDEDAVDAAAKRGHEVFQRAGCAECHAGVLMTDMQFHNTGVGMAADQPDLGRYKVSQREEDRGAFKTPTLRDVVDSAPYFHDGSAATLEEAVRQMAGGGLPNPWLSPKLKKADLTDDEIGDLLAFLATLDQECEPRVPELP